MYALSLSRVRLFVTPWTVALQAPLPMEFSRQESWSGLPFPPPGDLPHPGIKPVSLAPPALTGGLFAPVPLGQMLDSGFSLTGEGRKLPSRGEDQNLVI